MKYSIVINQVGIVNAGLHTKTDIIDWALIDYIKDWHFSKNAKKIISENEELTWINVPHLLQSMPLLSERDANTNRLNKASQDTVTRRFKKLAELGLIKRFQLKDNSLYVRLTDLAVSVCFHNENNSLNQINSMPPARQIRTGCPPNEDSPCPPNEDSTSSILYQVDKKNIYTRFDFESIWGGYPIKDGKKGAEKHFHATVKTEEDYQNIKKALGKYILHLGNNDWKKPKNGSTWFNNWKDWVNWKEPMPIKKPLQVVL